MKNLHVLPTDHPSRLRYNIKTKIWELNEFPKYHTDIKSTHNIYITSEEEIKMQDWFIDDKYKQPMKYFGEGSLLISSKKIILTTDPDLIKNGVQAIDAEFLEWFCSKNGKVDFEKVNLNIVEQEYSTALVFKFFSADFETREKMLK